MVVLLQDDILKFKNSHFIRCFFFFLTIRHAFHILESKSVQTAEAAGSGTYPTQEQDPNCFAMPTRQCATTFLDLLTETTLQLGSLERISLQK